MEIMWKKEVEFSTFEDADKTGDGVLELFEDGEVEEVDLIRDNGEDVDMCFVDADPVFYIFGVSRCLFKKIEREY